MQLRVVFLAIFMFYNIKLCENKTNNKLQSKDMHPIFRYFKGYATGETLRIPGFLISPIIVVPATNQETNADIQNMSSIENIQENSNPFSEVIPIEIIHNYTTSREENINDIEVNFRQALDRGSVNKMEMGQVKINKTVINTNKTDTRTNKTVTNIKKVVTNSSKVNTTMQDKIMAPNTITTEKYNIQDNMTEVVTTTDSSGLYPNAVYNETVNTIAITNKPPEYFLLPPLLGENWNNFTLVNNINVLSENSTKPNRTNIDNVTKSPAVNVTGNIMKGPYPAALYNNIEIDELSITTNPYTNESPLPPLQDDRWASFSSSNEFRPLAGLYYDGFLHRPPTQNLGFVPYNRYVLY